MRNEDNLVEWQSMFDRWSTLPSVQPDAVVQPVEWKRSTLKILRLLAQKVGEGRSNPGGMPSERLLEELKKAIEENDDMWFTGAFWREDDPAWYGINVTNDDEEIDEPRRPVVSQIGKSISLALRYEQGRWETLRKRAREDMDSILIELTNRKPEKPAKKREERNVEDEQQ